MTTPSRSPVRHVLAFSGTFLPGYKAGGPIKSMVQLLDNLPESVQVILVTRDRDLGDAIPYKGLSGKIVSRGVHEVYYMNCRSIRHWIALLRMARRVTIDLVYLNSLWSPQFTILPLLAHRLGLLRARSVLLAPRGELSSGALGIKSAKKRAFLHLWAPTLRRLNPLWHASSDMEQRDIGRMFPWARTVVQVDSRGDEPRREVIGSVPRARLVFLSRISRMKNLELALKAFQLIESEVNFDIYGPIEDSRYWDGCLRLIAEMPLNVRASYRGMVSPDQVQATFAQYDAFILPTLGENFGHAIGESLSAGCPVVCSQLTPWTEVLNDGGGATLAAFDPNAWATEIERRANETPNERDGAKRAAVAAYSKWRQEVGNTSAVEIALNEVSPLTLSAAGGGPRRVALITQGYQTAGGIQTAARWLVAGLRGAGFEVEVFNLASSRADPVSRRLRSPSSWRSATLLAPDSVEPQLTHVGANGVELEPLRYVPRAELTIELDRFDLVHVVAGAPALALAAARSRRPVVVQVATTVAWERASQLRAEASALAFWRRAMTRVTSLMERAALTKVDAVLVMNREMQDFVRSVSPARAVLAPPGIDTERFAPPMQEWDRSGYLLSVCRLSDARKGLERLIRSYALMVDMRPSLPDLVLAGRGVAPAGITRLIAELGVSTRVNIRSDVPQADLPSLYRGASVYLQSSYEEGFGISVLEAMACGLPVVATDTAGTRETVAHGETGWLVSQDDDVASVMADRTLALWVGDGRGMSQRARNRAVLMFSDDATLSRILDVYWQLMPNSPVHHL